jgi:hypothetical protein
MMSSISPFVFDDAYEGKSGESVPMSGADCTPRCEVGRNHVGTEMRSFRTRIGESLEHEITCYYAETIRLP